MDSIVNFRREIAQDLELLEAKASEIKAKFANNMHIEGQKGGFLMGKLESYESCMNFDKRRLNEMLREDEEIW